MKVRAINGVDPFFWRQAVGFFELARKMTLVGKSAGACCIGDGGAREQRVTRMVQPAHQQIAIGAGAKQRPEVVRQLPTIVASERF